MYPITEETNTPTKTLPYSTTSPILILDDDDDDDEDPCNSVIWLTINSADNTEFKLTLYKESKDGISTPTYWLNDSEIYAAQILLKTSFPQVDGLQDPAVRSQLVIPATSEFVQVINVGRHWVCISTIGCLAGVVKAFDSLYHKPCPLLIDHVCRMLLCPLDTVTFLNEKVQRQFGGSNCGLFALAFATDLCHGLDPTTQTYSQSQMRQHYISCLESGQMTPFPKTSKRVQYHLSCMKTSVPIYCLCRLPNDKKQYVECFTCDGWYHPDCASVPKWAINSRLQWRCQKCKVNRQKKGLAKMLSSVDNLKSS